MMQKQRYYELDLARAIPMLGMPFVHVYEEFLMHGLAAPGVWEQGQIFLYLCMFGPSVFMLSLGMNLVFSTHSSPRELFQRGIKTLLMFYGLNVLRYIIPGCIAYVCKDTEALKSMSRQFLCSDILFFASFTFLFFALMKKLSIKPFTILLIATLMLTLDMLIPELQFESELLSIALGKFFYVNGWSCFPILSWMIYPAIGYCVGFALEKRSEEQEHRKFWNEIILGSIVGLLAVGVCMVSYGLDPIIIAASPANHYIVNTANVVLDLLVAGLMYGFYYYVHSPIRNTKVMDGISILSRGILVFYCTHWILVGWLEYILLALGLRNQYSFGMKSIVAFSIIIMVFSTLLTIYLQIHLKKRKE